MPALPDPDQLTQAAEHLARMVPLRSAAADGGTLTLPLVALVVAPLKDEADVAGDADAAPRHGHRRAARERAGMPGTLRVPVTGERYAAIAVA